MPIPPWNPDQADLLLERGLITPEQHHRFKQDVAGASLPPPVGSSVAPPAGPPTLPPSPPPPAPPAVAGGPPPAVAGPPPPPAPKPMGPITVEGGVTFAPKPHAPPPAPGAGPKPEPSPELVRAMQGQPPLPIRQARDPEYRKLVTERDSERAPVDEARKDVQAAHDRKTALVVDEANEAYLLKQQHDAIIEQRKLEDEKARAKDNDLMLAELKAVNDEAKAVSQARIDSGRLYRNKSTGDRVLAGVVSFFGAFIPGVRAGFRGLVDDNIEADLKAQETDLENRKGALNIRRGVLGDMVKLYGDRDAGRLAAQAHMKEAAASDFERLAAKRQPDKVQADALAEAAHLRKQAEEERFQANDMLFKGLQSKRAAAAAAQAALAKEASGRRWELLKEQNKQAYEALQQAQKDGTEAPAWAMKALSMTKDDVPKGMPGGGITKEERKEHRKSQEELDGALQTVDSFQQKVDSLVEGGPVGAAAAGVGVPNWVPGAATAKRNANERNNYNVQIKTLIGAAYKLSTNAAEPKNKALIDEYAKPYVIEPSDDKDQATQKMENFKRFLVNAGRNKGVEPSRMPDPLDRSNDDNDPYAKFRVK